MENPVANTSIHAETLEDCLAANELRGTPTFLYDFETKACKTGQLNENGGPYVSYPNETRAVYIKKES